jgi:hypothetical protein
MHHYAEFGRVVYKNLMKAGSPYGQPSSLRKTGFHRGVWVGKPDAAKRKRLVGGQDDA